MQLISAFMLCVVWSGTRQMTLFMISGYEAVAVKDQSESTLLCVIKESLSVKLSMVKYMAVPVNELTQKFL
jgi:hypothetical protein